MLGSAETSQRLACDASRLEMRHDADGVVVEVSGPTTLSNLALLCRRHHRAVHEEGFRVERRESGELEFRSPHGWVLPYAPPPRRTPDDAEAKVRAGNTAPGISIHPHTATPKWNGERLNLGWAIDVLHPRANPL